MTEQYIIVVYFIGTILLTIFAISLVVLLVIQKQRQAKSKMEKQALEFKHQTDLLTTRLEVQEQSMTLISEEIHDNVGQLLGLTKMYLFRLSDHLADDTGRGLLDDSKELVSKAIGDLRHISHSLNSELLQEIGLIPSLEREMEFMRSNSDMDCRFQVMGKVVPLSREQNLLLFRIVQEVMQNVQKHAQANKLELTLFFGDEELLMDITDNGVGFDPAAVIRNESLGMRNIRNRAKLLGAELEITSSPGNGTMVHLCIPLKNTNHEDNTTN